jgi:hypothetical protein
MSTEKPQLIPPAVARIALPLVFGVMIELACDLLKHVVRFFSTSIYSDLKLGVWEQLREFDTWIGLVFAIVLVALSTWILDSWKWADPRRWVRTGLLLISVMLTGMVDPLGHVFQDQLLAAFGKAQLGEPMSVVLGRIQYSSPSLLWPHKDSKDVLDCTGNCWIRLTYDVPVFFGESSIVLDFDRDQRLTGKHRLD